MLRKILVVDDNFINRQVLKKTLSTEYEVLEANDGKQAMELLQGKYKQISAVLLDIIMPIMDGYEVLSAMRDDKELSQIPVIVTTGSTEEETEAKALSLGANDYLTKPYNPSIIKQRLRNTIRLRENAAIINALQRDELTGLFNRRFFLENAASMIADKPAGYYVFACFDINSFKTINDQYGTDKGDYILKQLANIFQGGFEPIGGLCSRIMSDIYAMLYPAKYMDSEVLAEIRRKARRPDYTLQPINYSIGRYIVNDKSISASSMYDRAMMALNSIKGKYNVTTALYTESMREKLLHEQKIVTEMHDALKGGQFEAWYQPQYNHVTGAMVGAEALVRWRHPDSGLLVAPGAFIPVFERNGFIYELDKFVWEQACILLKRWQDEGRTLIPISVNVSRNDVFKDDFLSVTGGLIEKYGIPVDMLRFEITESAFAESTEQIVTVIKALIEQGFTVEIDDFGSGYSSLNTLKDVPASILKLDMRFLENTNDSQRGGNILESVVRMAKWLGMAVIAEGVETKPQADYLKSIGCTYIQGYLYSRPIPVAEFDKLTRESQLESQMSVLETVETLDNNTFWDPKSMDTLIFNSYVGGACIVEYHNGKTELLRINDKYIQEMGFSLNDADYMERLDPDNYLDNENKRKVEKNIQNAIAKGVESSCEIFMDRMGQKQKRTYIRTTVRVIAKATDRWLLYCSVLNITEQREAEERIRQNAERMQNIMCNIYGGVTAVRIINDKPEYLYANDQYFEQLGYTRTQFTAEVANPFQLIHPDDRAEIAERTRQASITRRPFTCVYRAIRRDGSQAWLQSKVSITSFPNIKEPVQLSVANDLSAIKEAERVAHEVSAQLQAIIENVNGGVSAASYHDGKIDYVYVNDTYFEVLGYTSEQFNSELKNGIFDLMLSEDKQLAYKAIYENESIGKPATSEFRIKRRDGSVAWIRSSSSICRIDRIQYPVHIAVINDITGEKESEQQIRRLNDELRTFMNDIPGGFCRTRITAENSFNMVYANEGFCKLVGMTHEQVMSLYGKNSLMALYPEDRKAALRVYGEAAKGDGHFNQRYRLLRNDQSYVWVSAAGSVRKGEGEKLYLNTYYTDISAQLRMEAQQRDLLDNLPCGAALYEIEGTNIKAVHLNKRYCELVGRDIPDPSQVVVTDFIHPDDIETVMKEISAAIRHKRNAAADIRILHADGNYIAFHVVGKLISRKDSKYSFYTTYLLIDESDLSLQEILPFILETIMKSSSDLSFAKDKNLNYICCSKNFSDMTGLETERDVVGKDDFDLFPRDVAEKYRKDDMRLIESGKSLIDIVERIPTKDGVTRYSKTSKYLLRDTLGNVIGLYGVGRDITEYKAAYEQLSFLNNSIPGGIAVFEVRKDVVHARYMSDGVYELIGYSRDDKANLPMGNALDFVLEEDKLMISKQILKLWDDDTPLDFNYRVRLADGGFKWLSFRGAISERLEDRVIVNAALFDVTEKQEAIEMLRMSEEQFRVAIDLAGSSVARYDIQEKVMYHDINLLLRLGFGHAIPNVPQTLIDAKIIRQGCEQDVEIFFDCLERGEKNCSTSASLMADDGSYRWFRIDGTSVRDDSGKATQAVMVFHDITEQREKETVYKRWQQSLNERPLDSYTLFRCNLSKNTSFDSAEGSLLTYEFNDDDCSFKERTMDYVSRHVFPADRDRYIAVLNPDTLLANYYRGKRTDALEYREVRLDGSLRWLKLSIELVEYPNSNDVEIFLMYEDIDENKQNEIATRELVENDPLTGVLNRAAFREKVNQHIAKAEFDSQHALLMLDIDGFKLVNDCFGHDMGDKTLIDLTKSVRKVLRHDDLLGRLGGDEFVVFLKDIKDDRAIAQKTDQICVAMRRQYENNVKVSVSIGIAVCHRDGRDFDTLYKKADETLYHVKESGKGSFAFYGDDVEIIDDLREAKPELIGGRGKSFKRRLLMIDDVPSDSETIREVFSNEFSVTVMNSTTVGMLRLRHWGSAVSAVLVSIDGGEVDGLSVLENMRSNIELQTIPVIAICRSINREKTLMALRLGATEVIGRPVDSEIARVRIQAAINKADTERLRAQNNYLMLQGEELSKYRVVLEYSGTMVIEYDWVNGRFVYDPLITKYIAGVYDTRRLWHILMSDMVANAMDVRKMQTLVHDVAADRERDFASLEVPLKTPSGAKHMFRMCIYKQLNEFRLTDKLVITFNDIENELKD